MNPNSKHDHLAIVIVGVATTAAAWLICATALAWGYLL